MKKKTEIRFEIERDAYDRINKALEEYADFEIGGMLIGYQRDHNHFSISEATVADDIGQFRIASFIREPKKSIRVLVRRFKKQRHNYIGEWHSHPSFALYPSTNDMATMKGIIRDPDYGVNFALLIIAKLKRGEAQMAGFLFLQRIDGFAQATVTSKSDRMDSIDFVG